jgi:DNA mismatch repair protein MutS2
MEPPAVRAAISPHTLAVLEFGKVLPELADRADSLWGKELAQEIRPAFDLEAARAALAELAEWRLLGTGDPTPPGLGVPDVREALKHAAHPGAVLEPSELLEVTRMAATSRLTREVLTRRAPDAPVLSAKAILELGAFPALEAAVTQAIDERAQVRDQASPVLRKLRREIESNRVAIRERLERWAARIGPASFVTERGGRHTVAVPISWLGRVKGVVHDRSASEATVFLEPFEVVEPGNRLRESEEEERAEVRRILAALTAQVGREEAVLHAAAAELARLDCLEAKARLFRDWSCTLPELCLGGPIDLRNGRHPLVARARAAAKGSVVPLRLRLGGEARILVITGPNMGGKTVALKTLGLLTLMGMAGLGVPAEEGTALGFFPTIIADIGDEQSIEENLSTFASHVRQLGAAVEYASPTSLILLDELGAGTDPAEGAALGQAVLERLAASGALGVVTTHHGALKSMATDNPAIVNASMAFDPESQAPLYVLVSGVPGRSLGIDVAERLGFPPAVLARARGLVPEAERRLGELLADVERRRVELETAQAGLEDAREAASSLMAKYRERLAEIRELKQRVLGEARGQVAAVVAEAEETLRAARRVLRAAGERARTPIGEASEDARGAAGEGGGTGIGAGMGEDAGGVSEDPGREIETLGATLKMIRAGVEPATIQGSGMPPLAIETGVAYWVPDLAAMVEVIRLPDQAGRVLVQCRGLKLELAASRLRVASAAGPSAMAQGKALAAAKAQAAPVAPWVEVEMPPSFEIDLRGLTGDEAVAEVERYLEQASVHGLKLVRIIHGKGTGALRARMQEVLRGHPRVAAFRLGQVGEGGGGVTVVEIV